MARELRENVAGGIYHVFARGNRRALIYYDDYDRLTYLTVLGKVIEATHWNCLAYCLMENHVHLVLETPSPNLSAGMQRLQGRYAQRFNLRHGHTGHVFQGRFGAIRVTSDGQLRAVAAYVARNPVEARLCRRPEDWPWGSARGLAGQPTPNWLHLGRLRELLDET